MKKILIAFFYISLSFSSSKTLANDAKQESCQSRVIISSFVSDLFYQEPQKITQSLHGTAFNTLATTLVWSVIEKKRGEYDISMYYPQLDALTHAGYCLILLIDTSGRSLKSDIAKILVNDINTIPPTSLPAWVNQIAPQSKSVDFYGSPSETLDFEDTTSLGLVVNLYTNILPKLKSRYGNNIIGISPCITSECEIKYSQTGFKWQSYAPPSQNAFSAYLKSAGIKPTTMPTIDYGNHLGNGNPRSNSLYPQLQAFREKSIRDYTCTLTNIIKNNAIPSIGYFGQTFALPDGIYATGVIEKTTDCFDIAAIDYNFYNGHDVEFKPEIPAFIADYALTLGYKNIIIGVYMERFRDPKSLKIDPRGYKILSESIQKIKPNEKIRGIEIGNLTGNEFMEIEFVKKLFENIRTTTSKKIKLKKVAIYASITNSYLWIGEWSNNRQIMQDNLLATYKELSGYQDIQVELITDTQLRERPWITNDYTLIVLPHLSSMPEESRNALIKYKTLGGALLADMRLDEYQPSGELQSDSSLRNALGIGATKAFKSPASFEHDINLEPQNQYVDGFLIAPLEGFSVGLKSINGKGEGVIVRSSKTTMFGFLPLLIEGKNKKWGREQFRSEVLRLIQ